MDNILLDGIIPSDALEEGVHSVDSILIMGPMASTAPGIRDLYVGSIQLEIYMLSDGPRKKSRLFR